MTREAIYNYMRDVLVETFELKPEQITPDAQLFQDLDLDSIDAVDLIVKLQQFINKKVNPETFKKVRTVNDVVDAIYKLVQE